MNVIILLSGSSSRFFKEGYKVPKFSIKVNGKSILKYIISNFDTKNDNFIFICRRDFYYNKDYNIEKDIKGNCKQYKIYLIDSHKLGPVYSLKKFSIKIKKLKDVIINYCDFFWIWKYGKFKSRLIFIQAIWSISSHKTCGEFIAYFFSMIVKIVPFLGVET